MDINEIHAKLLQMHQEPMEGRNPEQLRREVFEILDCLVFTQIEMGRKCLEALASMDPMEYRDFLARSNCALEIAKMAINLYLRHRAGWKNSSLYAEALEIANLSRQAQVKKAEMN